MRLRSLATLAIGLLLCPAAASALELRVLSSWNETYPATPKLLNVFLKNVETASKGDITFKVSGPETVPPFEQLQPVSTGVFQMLFTQGAYHPGQIPALFAVEAFSGDLKKWREAGVRDELDKFYKRVGLKLIALCQSPPGTAYHIILRQPASAAGDLHGRKIRGTQTYGGALALLGASPVVLPHGEIYSALEKGVVDGAAFPAIGVLDYRWYEVAKYLLRPTFGNLVHSILINLDTWNKLSDAQKKVMLSEGNKIEDVWFDEWVRLANEEQRELLARGSQITQMGEAQQAKISKAMADTLMQLGTQYNAKEVGELREFGKAKGLY